MFFDWRFIFLAMMLGKEGYCGHWCCYCDLSPSQWSSCSCTGNNWTVQTLTSKAKEIINKRLTGDDCCGIREPPYCNITISNVIWLVLHCIIGIGNQILTFLIDYVETNIKKILPHEVQLRESIP